MNKRTPSFFWLLTAAALFPISQAHAYVDLGSGSYAVQIAIGFIFGGTYAFKSFLGRFVSKVRLKSASKKTDQE